MLRCAKAKRLIADLFGVDAFDMAAIAGVTWWCLFFLTICFGCCSSLQMANWVSLLDFLRMVPTVGATAYPRGGSASTLGGSIRLG
jgi:hypothetical protein